MYRMLMVQMIKNNKIIRNSFVFIMSLGFFTQIFCSENPTLYSRLDFPWDPQPHPKSKGSSDQKVQKIIEVICFKDSVIPRPIQFLTTPVELRLVNTTIDGDILFPESSNPEENIVKVCLNSRIYGRVVNGTIIVVPELAESSYARFNS